MQKVNAAHGLFLAKGQLAGVRLLLRNDLSSPSVKMQKPMPFIDFLFCAFAFESSAFNATAQNKKANPQGWPFAFICGSGEIRTLVQMRKK